MGQGLVFAISTGGFAILARILGPEPYAQFAAILFIYTAASLVTDLSPQAFAIVNGLRRDVLRTARNLAAISSTAGVIVMSTALAVAPVQLSPESALDPITLLLLSVALVSQMMTQVPRSVFVMTNNYKTLVFIDVSSTAFGLALSIAVAALNPSAFALTLQLSVTAILRAFLTLIARRFVGPRHLEPGSGASTRSAVGFGLRVIPINLASYLSRALDSGLLPGILPAVAAGGYVRSYQLVIVPISQVQLSLGPAVLERFSRAFELHGRHDLRLTRRVWNFLQFVAVASGISIAVLSPLIQTLLFGPKWPMVNVMIAAMGCMLPSLAGAMFYSWTLQVSARLWQTISHLLIMTTTPLLVIAGALVGGTQLAICCLVAGSAIQPLALMLLHRGAAPSSLATLAVQSLASWFVMAALFAYIASTSGFWSFTF